MCGAVWSHKSDLTILTGPFLLGIFYNIYEKKTFLKCKVLH